MKFSELNLEDSVLQALDAMNFQECTPVQEQTIPVILEGKDLIGVAQTGTARKDCCIFIASHQPAKQRRLSRRCHKLCHHVPHP